MNQSIDADLAAVVPAMAESGLASCVCSILEPDGVFGPSGAASGQYVAISGLSDLPCAVAPLGIGSSVQPTELKEITEIMSRSPLHVTLMGYYPQIRAGHRCAITFPTGAVSGNYEVFGCESDSQAQATRLAVLEISV